jgi:hypothetical protein
MGLFTRPTAALRAGHTVFFFSTREDGVLREPD